MIASAHIPARDGERYSYGVTREMGSRLGNRESVVGQSFDSSEQSSILAYQGLREGMP